MYGSQHSLSLPLLGLSSRAAQQIRPATFASQLDFDGAEETEPSVVPVNSQSPGIDEGGLKLIQTRSLPKSALAAGVIAMILLFIGIFILFFGNDSQAEISPADCEIVPTEITAIKVLKSITCFPSHTYFYREKSIRRNHPVC